MAHIRPQNLQRLLIAEIAVAGLGALETARWTLGGDHQWYTGYADRERPDTAYDQFWDNLFTKYTGLEDNFVTPEQAKPGEKRLRDGKAKKSLFSPEDESKKRIRGPEPNIPSPDPKRPRQSVNMPQLGVADVGPGNEDNLKPYGSTALIRPDYFTFRGRTMVTDELQLNSRNNDGSPQNTISTSRILRIRLNSPADINLNVTGAAEGNRPIKGFKDWSTYYTHYRVIKTEVKCYFNRRRWAIALTGATAVNNVINFYDDTPAVCGFVCDPSGRLGTTLAGKDYRALLQGKHVAHKYIIGGQQAGFTYTYTPEQWDASLNNQQTTAFWTEVTKNPINNDVLCFFVAPCAGNCTGNVDCIVEVEQTIQMREFNDTTLGGIYTQDTVISTADNAAMDGS